MTLNIAAKSGTFTVTRAGDGTVSATSSDTRVATVSVSGTTVTVTGKAYGTATITVKVAAGTNHTAPASKTCGVTVNIFKSVLSSNTWDEVRAASDAGEGGNYWAVGDTHPVTINGKVGNTTFSNLSVDAFILFEGRPLCAVTSQHAHNYFTQDDDGQGRERGALVGAILARLETPPRASLERRGAVQARWDKLWADARCRRYKRVEHEDFWIWNHDFYNAPLVDLWHIAALVGAKPGGIEPFGGAPVGV